MLALIQRVNHASVTVDNKVIGSIEQGILALIGVEKQDNENNIDKLLNKILNYRIFSDSQDKMNLSLKDINGGLLLVPQFTLAADTRKGLRPSFSSAAAPDVGEKLFTSLVTKAQQLHSNIASGEFSATMQVDLCNDGPVTFLLSIT